MKQIERFITNETDGGLFMGRVMTLDLSDTDLNVMQVAIESYMEELEYLQEDDISGTFASRRETTQRLSSARHLKTLFQDID